MSDMVTVCDRLWFQMLFDKVPVSDRETRVFGMRILHTCTPLASVRPSGSVGVEMQWGGVVLPGKKELFQFVM